MAPLHRYPGQLGLLGPLRQLGLLGPLRLLGLLGVGLLGPLRPLGLQGVLRWLLCLRWRAVLYVVFVLYVVPGGKLSLLRSAAWQGGGAGAMGRLKG